MVRGVEAVVDYLKIVDGESETDVVHCSFEFVECHLVALSIVHVAEGFLQILKSLFNTSPKQVHHLTNKVFASLTKAVSGL